MQLRRSKVGTQAWVFWIQVLDVLSYLHTQLFFLCTSYRLTLTVASALSVHRYLHLLTDCLGGAWRCAKCFTGMIPFICLISFLNSVTAAILDWVIIDWLINRSEILGKYSFIKQTSYHIALLWALLDFIPLFPDVATVCYLFYELLEDKDYEFSSEFIK